MWSDAMFGAGNFLGSKFLVPALDRRSDDGQRADLRLKRGILSETKAFQKRQKGGSRPTP